MQVAVLLVGMVVSFAVSIVAIKFLMSYIRKNDFKVFGYYRIVLGVIVFLFWNPGTACLKYYRLGHDIQKTHWFA